MTGEIILFTELLLIQASIIFYVDLLRLRKNLPIFSFRFSKYWLQLETCSDCQRTSWPGNWLHGVHLHSFWMIDHSPFQEDTQNVEWDIFCFCTTDDLYAKQKSQSHEVFTFVRELSTAGTSFLPQGLKSIIRTSSALSQHFLSLALSLLSPSIKAD